MRSTLVFKLLLLAGLPLFTGCQATLIDWVAARFFLPKEGIRPAAYAVKVEREVAMTTSDGILLAADIYHPKTEAKTPTILVRIPVTETRTNVIRADVVARFWAKRGYTVVIQGTRGRYRSGGRFYPLRHERQDGLETLAWIARQPWYDGRLGMWGGSAFGYTQWVLADQKDPGPSALILQICSTDFHGVFYPGGAFALESALFWAGRSRGQRDQMPSQETLQQGYQGFPLVEADDRSVGDTDFFNDWVNHPERDAYWLAIDGTDRTHTLKAPALLMAGWFDPFLPTQLNDFVSIRHFAEPKVASATRLIIGPWAHAHTVKLPGNPPLDKYRKESIAPSLAWFDQHLGYADTAASRTAPVRIFVMGKNTWRDEQEWPLARTRYTPYYLHSSGNANSLNGDGTLNLNPPTLAEPPDTYIYDPHDPVPTAGGAMLGPRAGTALQNTVETRPDVLVYSTPSLENALELTGPITLITYVSTTAPNTDFTAKLVDVHPDGSAYNLSAGILRQPYKPNATPVKIEIALWPTSNVLRQGHRIRLEVSSSNYPQFDRNPNTGTPIATETQPTTAAQTIYHGHQTPSRLILPVIPSAP